MPREDEDAGAWDDPPDIDPGESELERAYAAGLAEGILAGREGAYARGWRDCLAARRTDRNRNTEKKETPT